MQDAGVVMTRGQPLRTCIGCRSRDVQRKLLRMVVTHDDGVSAVVVDVHHRRTGRGAWLHPSPSCLAMAMKRRAFNRAFRGAVDTRDVESYIHAAEPSGTFGRSTTTVQPESGQK